MDEKLFHNEHYWVSSFDYLDEVTKDFDLPERL